MESHDNPGRYPRRILLAVTGLSPQVVTETLYALTQSAGHRLVPTEVRVITTAEGAERARLALLSDEPGWFTRFLADYGLPPIAFDESHILILKNGEGLPLADIRTPADNERAADFITEQVRELTSDPDSALHVSIAGGRKTMGFYLGYALSLFGRPQDRLSHVLVSEPFESSWEFFYPTPYNRVITTRENKLVNTAEAEVALAEIPFVSLRHGLPEPLLEGKTTFGSTVAAARRALGPPDLVIDLMARTVRASGETLTVPPFELAFLAWFARRRVAGEPGLPCPVEGAPEPAYAEAYLAEYRGIIGEMGDDERTRARLDAGMPKDFFEQTKSKLNRRLARRLGPAAEPYQVAAHGPRPKRYGLGVPASSVRFGSAPGAKDQPHSTGQGEVHG